MALSADRLKAYRPPGSKKQRKTKKGLTKGATKHIIKTEREDRTMTKMELVNRMIILGCIKETDRNHFMRKTKDELTKLYITVIPMRLEHLGRA